MRLIGAIAHAAGSIAQNWLDLRAERALSTFDQRHLLNLPAQYTSGQGLGGGTLMSGWRGRAAQGVDPADADHRRHRIAGDADLSRSPFRARASSDTLRPSLTGASIYSVERGRASQRSRL